MTVKIFLYDGTYTEVKTHESKSTILANLENSMDWFSVGNLVLPETDIAGLLFEE